MIILFKPEFRQMILTGNKTETRRTWKTERVKEGCLYEARTNKHSQTFAYLDITHVFREKLGAITPEGVVREGFVTMGEFQRAWIRIYGEWDPEVEVTVVQFKVDTGADKFPLGCEVIVTKDNGSEVWTTTRSRPFRIGGSFVMLVDGIAGGYLLDRIRRIESVED